MHDVHYADGTAGAMDLKTLRHWCNQGARSTLTREANLAPGNANDDDTEDPMTMAAGGELLSASGGSPQRAASEFRGVRVSKRESPSGNRYRLYVTSKR
jgi:hypothetical protein